MPSVSIAKASGARRILAPWISPALAQENVPASSRLVIKTQARAVKVKHLQPRVPFIAEDKERSAFDFLHEPLSHQTGETFKALAHIAGLQRHEDLQTARKA